MDPLRSQERRRELEVARRRAAQERSVADAALMAAQAQLAERHEQLCKRDLEVRHECCLELR